MKIPISSNLDSIPVDEELNPLLEGISIASSEVEFLRLLPRNPFLDKNWLINHQDIDLFRAYLSSVVVPTKQVLKIGLDIHRAFKTSAYQLNPRAQNNRIAYFSTSYSTTAREITQTTHCGVVILGLTGLGKTYALVAALGTIPQTIHRFGFPNMSKVTQITWIRLDMSSIASIEALAEQIIRSIDEALGLGGKIYDQTLAGVRGASAKMERALRLMKTHYLTMLVVDEIQANNFAKPNSADLRFWFLRIANQKIALIFSGNPLGFELSPPKKETDQSRIATQQLRRLFSSNRTRLDPAESIDDPDWTRLTRTLARCHLDGHHSPINRDIEELKHILTGGFPDFYIALHCELEKFNLRNPGQIYNMESIYQAAKSSSLIQQMQPLITAFANRDPIALRKCIDVDHDYYQRMWWNFTNLKTVDAEEQATIRNIASQPQRIDPIKAIEADRKRIERKGNKKRLDAKQPTSTVKAEIINYHLDQVGMLIKG